jgi:5-methylcytosine-specific restriction endonuclease McrA
MEVCFSSPFIRSDKVSVNKKTVRAQFRRAVFLRDRYCCRMCGVCGVDRQEQPDVAIVLDAHHITDRNLMPDGGYVPENGITLCAGCHVLAEQLWQTGVAAPGFAPDDLYRKIGSSYAIALGKIRG